ncbi:MAG: LysM peptidoglycan-binding domain-containing M23 family metallopeptidase [Treponema sp.]|jgi:murein DD-endopeptidase MepM/ murein hydrolase activator NlpD|nr:LysM peptidoglycan-binding domain-containing M23 family metallopeptidase [Treponema sp.]
MFSFYENDLAPLCSKVSRNSFRLAAILCLVLIVNPVKFDKRQTPLIEEDGIGGGIFLEKVFSDDVDDSLISASLILGDTLEGEIVIPEPGSFPKHRTLLYDFHTVLRGENISTLANNYGLNQDSIISINKISSTRLLQIGRVLKIPNQNGILHTVRGGETLSSIAQRYNADSEAIRITNELFSEKIAAGTELFIPGARLDWTRLQEINGDLFIWPLSGIVTSGYGYRRDPFNPSRRHFHNGIDIRGRSGAPVRAAMSGRVSRVGWDNVLGNYVVISHHSGYRSLYGHLSVIRTRTGAYVAQGERVGDVGSTGQSTGPHLHFTIYRNGVTVNPRALMR